MNRSPSDNSNFSKPKSNYKVKNPRTQMKTMKSNDETASIKIMNANIENETSSSTSTSLFSSWGNTSEQPFTPIVRENLSITMATISCANINTTNTTPAAIATPSDIPAKTFSHNSFTSRSKTLIALHYMLMEHARRSGGLEQEYHEKCHSLPVITQLRFFKRHLVDFKYPCNAEYEVEGGISSKFTGFGWNPRCIVSGTIKDEVRNPTGSFMELIYRANEIVFNPITTHAIPIKKPTRDHSGSLDVLRYCDFRTRWYPQGTPGAYESTATSVHEYFTAMSRI